MLESIKTLKFASPWPTPADMSIDAVMGRISAIVAMEQQLLSPAVSPAASPSSATAPASATATSDFASNLAGAQSASASSSASAAGYVSPFAAASVHAERIDQGVDYSGSGTVGAIGPGVVTNVAHTGSGWEGGGYVEYRLTAGPYAGRSVYYAEGVTPSVSVGQTLSPGQAVATIVPGSATGIEVGFAAGRGQSAYAGALGGGYGEGQLTAAGQAFSDLLASLGAPAGLAEGRTVTGHFP